MIKKQRTPRIISSTYPTELPSSNKLRVNFLLSVLLLIIGLIIRIVSEIQQLSIHPALNSNPFSQRPLNSHIGYLCGVLLIWYFIYRPNKSVSRIFAGLTGINIVVMFIFVPLIVSDMNNSSISGGHIGFYLYIAISHLAYAFFYKASNPDITIVGYYRQKDELKGKRSR